LGSINTYEIRPLTEAEIVQLEETLGNPIERTYLVHWVCAAIRDVVKLSTLPSRREYRDELEEIARQGRGWVETVTQSRSASFLPKVLDVEGLTGSVRKLCESIESLASQLDSSVEPGHPRTHFALEAFLGRMIGVAKQAKVLPSTPGRGERSQTAPRPPPPFYNFVAESLEIAIEVIKSSPLPEAEKHAALSILASVTDGALIKILERLRGQIRDYRESAGGLIEKRWTSPEESNTQ
jgi:hypothetical protein